MDERGNHISDITYNPDGSLFDKVSQKYKYDEKGNEIEEIKYLPDGQIESKYTFKYEYDSQDNWIKKTSFENETAVQIAERKIEYFP
jgi:antitoxin component YwqK of YwqJK toxin-antitoxin module